jgi:hypothetical protein
MYVRQYVGFAEAVILIRSVLISYILLIKRLGMRGGSWGGDGVSTYDFA